MHNNNFGYISHVIEGHDFKDLSSFFHPEFVKIARDELFINVLDSFHNQPIKVFQVGAVESLSSVFRIGSGWSELFWGSYIKKNLGELHVVDINLDHLAHSGFLASSQGYQANLSMGDAIDFIVPGFNIYYLDGADINQSSDAYQQTLNQFKKIEGSNSIVLVDDVPTKAKALIEYVNPISEEKGWHVKIYENYGNGMMTIDMRK